MVLSTLRRWWPLAGTAGLVAMAAVAAAHSSLGISRVDEPAGGLPALTEPSPRDSPPSPPPVAEAGGERTEMPEWILTLAGTICALAVVAVTGLLLWALLGNRSTRRTGRMPTAPATGAPETRTAEQVVAVLDAGLVDLSDADGDPRRAVIACWVRLEQAAAAAGTPRQIGDTPTDLVTRLLRSHDVSADVLAELADAYRTARYATHTVDDRMRVQARAALHRLRAELTAADPPVPGRG